MDLASSDEWSAGCESGWTVYLGESYNSRSENIYAHHPQSYRIYSTVNDDEDQSMVSDASSGPPQYIQEDEQQCYNGINSQNCNSFSRNSEKLSKRKEKRSKKRESNKVGCTNNNQDYQQNLQFHGFSSSNHHLDDTASSPTITHSQIYANPSLMGGYSQNMSATHFQGSSSYTNHYGFWQSNNHLDDSHYSAQPGRGWE